MRGMFTNPHCICCCYIKSWSLLSFPKRKKEKKRTREDRQIVKNGVIRFRYYMTDIDILCCCNKIKAVAHLALKKAKGDKREKFVRSIIVGMYQAQQKKTFPHKEERIQREDQSRRDSFVQKAGARGKREKK